MRYLILGAAALGLAGCGSSNTTDFTIEVVGNASTVRQRLATLHHESTSTTGIMPATMTTIAIAAQRVDVRSIGFAGGYGAADWGASDSG